MSAGTRRHRPRWSPRSRATAAVSLVGALIGLTGAAAPAQAVPHPSADHVIHACYNKHTGIVRILSPHDHDGCRRHETPISWNEEGPRGPKGAPGTKAESVSLNANGTLAIPGPPDLVSTARLGVGHYLVTFNHSVVGCSRFAEFYLAPRLFTSGNLAFGQMVVLTFDTSGNPADAPFDLTVFC